ncbi:MAG: molybdopterin molybdotransferase MoeA [Selenomonadaceae bacterium]|nr:molybdopterin molybdotransferase MoeA [Selenomonadaceae bacterium]
MEGLILEDAIKILLAQVKKIEDVEKIPLLESVGRFTAKDYFAKFDNPPFNRSPLDGYALKSEETPGKFKIVGEECAGDFFDGEIKNSECLRIMTGAAIPVSCDCVIRQEDIQLDGENIFVPYKLKRHENFCFAGEDVKAGKILVKKNTKLNAKHIAILASQGFAEVEVYRLPKVAVASTGDELLNPNEKLSGGKIYNSNLFYMAARLKEFGFTPIILGNLRDDVEAACTKIRSVENEIDFLITTGGVSVGKKDIMHEVVKNLGEKIFWRVLIKPGAPVIGWKTEKFLGLALSGNPFAAFATFELLARYVLAEFTDNTEIIYAHTNAVMADEFNKKSPSRRFIRARRRQGRIYLQSQHESGSLYSAANCNCLVDIPAGTEKLSIGDVVNVILL